MNPDVFRNISYGLYVLTAKDVQKNKPTGCIINSAFQVTSNPAQFAISVNHDNFTNKCIKDTGFFALSIISENINPAIISSFGFRSGKDADKFEGVAYKTVNDLAVLDDSCGYLICKVENTMETETHTIFLGSVLDGDVVKNEPPMTYAYYHKVIKGKAPKNAPTYIEESKKEDNKDNKPVYKCKICGYVYDGEIPFEDLPDDYVCPICGAPKSDFEKV